MFDKYFNNVDNGDDGLNKAHGRVRVLFQNIKANRNENTADSKQISLVAKDLLDVLCYGTDLKQTYITSGTLSTDQKTLQFGTKPDVYETGTKYKFDHLFKLRAESKGTRYVYKGDAKNPKLQQDVFVVGKLYYDVGRGYGIHSTDGNVDSKQNWNTDYDQLLKDFKQKEKDLKTKGIVPGLISTRNENTSKIKYGELYKVSSDVALAQSPYTSVSYNQGLKNYSLTVVQSFNHIMASYLDTFWDSTVNKILCSFIRTCGKWTIIL